MSECKTCRGSGKVTCVDEAGMVTHCPDCYHERAQLEQILAQRQGVKEWLIGAVELAFKNMKPEPEPDTDQSALLRKCQSLLAAYHQCSLLPGHVQREKLDRRCEDLILEIRKAIE